VLSLSRQVLFLIPCLLILPLFWGLNGVWAAESVADFAASITAFFIMKAQFRKILGQASEDFDALLVPSSD
jgi:Na+-driven multidrug efflux pump